MKDPIWSFSPWVAFLLGVRIGGVYWGSGIALIVAAVVLVRAPALQRTHVRRHRHHLLRRSARVVYRNTSKRHRHLGPVRAAVAHGSLTLIVFGFVLIGRPFTERYAREQAPRRVWRTARFHELNRRLSAVWGLAFLVGTTSLIIAGSQDSRPLVLRLVVPFRTLILAFMYSPKAGQRERQSGRPTEAPSRPDLQPRPPLFGLADARRRQASLLGALGSIHFSSPASTTMNVSRAVPQVIACVSQVTDERLAVTLTGDGHRSLARSHPRANYFAEVSRRERCLIVER